MSNSVVRYVIRYIWRSGGTGHEHITDVYVVDTWNPAASGEVWTVEKAHNFVSGIGLYSGNLWVLPVDGNGPAAIIYPRKTATGKKYIQTQADGIWTNNLLALPDLAVVDPKVLPLKYASAAMEADARCHG